MIPSPYSLNAYIVLLKTNASKKRLLVEGETDKLLFQYFLDDAFPEKNAPICQQLSIDSVGTLIRSHDFLEYFEDGEQNRLGNREKIEILCRLVKKEPWNNRFLGFIDREFDGFEISESISDNLGDHRIVERLVCSKGHSIENYFFNKSIVRTIIKKFLSPEIFQEVVDEIDESFESIIKIACTFGLVGRDVGKIEKIKKSLHWSILELKDSQLRVNQSQWRDTLLNRQNFSEEGVNECLKSFVIWKSRVDALPIEVACRLCHGHIGIKFIWAAYGFFISQHAKPEKKIGNFKEEKCFPEFLEPWTRRVLRGECEHPFNVLWDLGFQIFSAS